MARALFAVMVALLTASGAWVGIPQAARALADGGEGDGMTALPEIADASTDLRPATDSPPTPVPSGDVGSGWISDRFIAGAAYSMDLTVAGGGTLWAATSEPGGPTPDQVRVSWSSDGGYTWVFDTVLNDPLNDYENATIAADVSSGRIYVAFESHSGGVPGAILLWTRDPFGTWSTGGSLVKGIVYDPDIVVENDRGASNRVYVTFTEQNDFAAFDTNISMVYSDDAGLNWNYVPVDGWSDAISRDQPAVAYGNGSLWIAYRNVTDFITSAVAVTDPVVGPFTYSTVQDPLFYLLSDPDIAVLRDGSMAVAVYTASGANLEIYGAFSPNLGLTWTTITPANSPDFEFAPSLTVDYMDSPSDTVRGRFHLVYADEDILGSRTLYYVSMDPADPSTWAGHLRVSDAGQQLITGIAGNGTAAVTQHRGTSEYPVVAGLFAWVPYATTPGWRSVFDTLSGLNLTIDGVNYTRSLSPFNFNWPAETVHTVLAPSPQLEVPSTSRWRFVSWDSGQSQAYVHTAPTAGDYYDNANFEYQVWVVIDTNPSSFDITVDNITASAPWSEWWDAGSVHNIDVVSPHVVGPGEVWQFWYWDDSGAQNHNVSTNGPVTFTAYFQGPFFAITLDTDPPGMLVNVSLQDYPAPYTFWCLAGSMPYIGVLDWVPNGTEVYVWMNWSDGQPPFHFLNPCSAPAAYTAYYETWYRLIVDLVPAGLDVTVDNSTFVTPYTVYCRPGDTHWLEAFDQSVNSTWYIFVNWSDGGAQQHGITCGNSPATYVASLGPSAFVSLQYEMYGNPVNNEPILIDGFQGTTPTGRTWLVNSTHTVEAVHPLPVTPTWRYSWRNWSDGGPRNNSYFVTGDATLTASYVNEFLVNISTDTPGTTYTVDDVPYTVPTSFWWEQGSVHWINTTDNQSGGPLARYMFQSWNGNPVLDYPLAVTGGVVLTADFGTDNLITLDTNPPGLEVEVNLVAGLTAPYSFWCYNLSVANIGIPSPQYNGSTRYVFENWSDGGGAFHNIPCGAPATYLANLTTQYRVFVTTLPTGLWIQVDGAWYITSGPGLMFWWNASSVHAILTNATQAPFGPVWYFVNWSDGGGISHPITINGPGTYTATFTNAAPTLTLTANADVTNGVAPLSVTFTASGSGGNGNYLWFWDFGDGTTATVQNPPTHVYTNPGVYNAWVWLNDTGGNSSDWNTLITVTAGPPVLDHCRVSPDPATLQVSTALQFTADGLTSGNVSIPGTAVTWSVSGTIGNVDAAGLFTAGATAGAGSVDATVTDGTDIVSCSAAVTVTAGAPPTVLINAILDGAAFTASPVLINGTATAATSVEVRAGGAAGTWQLATGTDTWTFSLDISGFPDGSILVEARAWNNTVESTWDSITITKQTPPAPTVAITFPAENDVLTTFTVQVSGTSANADTVEVRLDTGVWSLVTGVASWYFLYGGNANGPHVFEARAYSGTVESAHDWANFTVNYTPPPPIAVTITDPANNTAVSSNSLTISGTYTETEIVEVRIDGGTWTTANGTSSWSLVLDLSGLLDGVHTIEVRADDGSGEGYVTDEITFTLSRPVTQPAGFPWVLVALLAVVVAVLLLLLLLMRRRKQMAEPGPKASAREAELPSEAAPASGPTTLPGTSEAQAAAPAATASATPVQPAGPTAECVVCGKTLTEEEAIGCGKCDAPMHEACSEKTTFCPKCGAKFA